MKRILLLFAFLNVLAGAQNKPDNLNASLFIDARTNNLLSRMLLKEFELSYEGMNFYAIGKKFVVKSGTYKIRECASIINKNLTKVLSEVKLLKSI